MGAEFRLFNPFGLPLPNEGADAYAKIIKMHDQVR
jgi:hypothetical protein